MGAISTLSLKHESSARLQVAIYFFSKPMCIGYRAHGALLKACVGVLVGAPHGRDFHVVAEARKFCSPPGCDLLFLKTNVHWLSRAGALLQACVGVLVGACPGARFPRCR